MRFASNIFTKAKSRRLIGPDAANGRVTVEPTWSLKKTPPVWGNSYRGPYRYYTTPNIEEYEVPAIKSISWDRSYGQDLAKCTITLYNQWHELNSEDPEQSEDNSPTPVLGKPGFFWPHRGKGDSSVTWNQTAGRGAYKKDGTWDPNFSWSDVLVEDALLRTYEGYGGKPTKGNFISIDDNLSFGNTLITGVWIINTVNGGSDGTLTLDCVDIGRILLDQIVFPPLIPSPLYPLEYYPAGKSAFDSFWGPKVKKKVVVVDGEEVTTSPASKGEVLIKPLGRYPSTDSSIAAYTADKATDGDLRTFALSGAYDAPDGTGDNPYTTWFEYDVSAGLDSLQILTWAGGYTCYVSVYQDVNPAAPTGTSIWAGNETVPTDSPNNINYVKKIYVPQMAPDGMEFPIDIEFDETMYAQKIRITLQHLYYSGIADGAGDHYRSGIRNIVGYRNGSKVSPFSTELDKLPWTFAMTQHPTRGYWVMDNAGNVYGFGDALNYDSSAYGAVPIGSYGGTAYGFPTNRAVGMAAHPDGMGYWVVDWFGHVWGYGSAEGIGGAGSSTPGGFAVPDPYVPLGGSGKVGARGIAATPTGNGYWVIYSNGVIRGFGDASPNYATIPVTPVSTFMDAFLPANYTVGKFLPYNNCLKGTAIAGHPKQMKFIVTSGSGEVWESQTGTANLRRTTGLENRVYNKGKKNQFRLQPLEWATDIEYTADGDGYWISFGSGRIGSFGSALNKGPVDVYERIRGFYQDNVAFDESAFDVSFFREIIWGLARDPDGSGFWVLNAGGEVKSYEAEFWGKPGYDGLTGLKWHEGNFDGDWANVAKELLMWAGFTYNDGTVLDSGDAPSVLGLIENTGIRTDTTVPADKFDKRTIIDAVKELSEVTGYIFRITEEGGAQYASPNWWRAGNFDENGTPIYVDTLGDRVAVTKNEKGDLIVPVGAEPFIPTVHEDEDMLTYSATLSSADKRSEIIIGTDLPSPKDPTRTGYVRHIPPTALEEVRPGVSSMRGIERPALWVSQLFQNEEEMKLMAELIGLHAWFGMRTGSTTCVGNPALSPGDQVRLVEKNTSETFIHLISSLSSSLDNETGVYTMTLGTNWLGDADNWVIQNVSVDGVYPDDYPYVVISERLNSWQSLTNRGLSQTVGRTDDQIFTFTGGFTRSSTSLIPIDEMVVLGDSMSYLDSTLNGLTGDRWPNLIENSGAVTTVLNGAMSGATSEWLRNSANWIVDPTTTDALVVFLGANDQNESLSGVSPEEFQSNLEWFFANYPAAQKVIVYPWKWTGYPSGEPDPAPTELEYQTYRNRAAAAATAVGADFIDLGFLVPDPSDFIVDWIHPNAQGHEYIASKVAEKLYVPYGAGSGWVLESTLTTRDAITDLTVNTDMISACLGYYNTIEVYDDATLLYRTALPPAGQSVTLGNIGEDGVNKDYRILVYGTPASKGNGKIKITMSGDGTIESSVVDTILVLEGSDSSSGDGGGPPSGYDPGTTTGGGSTTPLPNPGPTLPPTPIPSSGTTFFGWSAESISDYNSLRASGLDQPNIWRDFEGTTFSDTNIWEAGVTISVSFKPDISQPVSTWSTNLENYLRTKPAALECYVSIWHEPEDNLSDSVMGSYANWQRALNEVTRVCRKLAAEGRKTYSCPIFMDYTMNPSSGRDINDWLPTGGVDYDIVGFDIYPTGALIGGGNQISAFNSGPFSGLGIADSIDRCANFAASRGKPWCIPEIGTRRSNSDLVYQYNGTQRAQFMLDASDYIQTRTHPPVWCAWYIYGFDGDPLRTNDVNTEPEKSAMNTIVGL